MADEKGELEWKWLKGLKIGIVGMLVIGCKGNYPSSPF